MSTVSWWIFRQSGGYRRAYISRSPEEAFLLAGSTVALALPLVVPLAGPIRVGALGGICQELQLAVEGINQISGSSM